MSIMSLSEYRSIPVCSRYAFLNLTFLVILKSGLIRSNDISVMLKSKQHINGPSLVCYDNN